MRNLIVFLALMLVVIMSKNVLANVTENYTLNGNDFTSSASSNYVGNIFEINASIPIVNGSMVKTANFNFLNNSIAVTANAQ